MYKDNNITHNISEIFPRKSVKLSSTFKHKYRILFIFLKTNVYMKLRMASG